MEDVLRKANEIKDILNNILSIIYPDESIVFYKVYDSNPNTKLVTSYIDITPNGNILFCTLKWDNYLIVIRTIETILINNGIPVHQKHIYDIKFLYEYILPFKDYSDDEIKLYFRMVS